MTWDFQQIQLSPWYIEPVITGKFVEVSKQPLPRYDTPTQSLPMTVYYILIYINHWKPKWFKIILLLLPIGNKNKKSGPWQVTTGNSPPKLLKRKYFIYINVLYWWRVFHCKQITTSCPSNELFGGQLALLTHLTLSGPKARFCDIPIQRICCIHIRIYLWRRFNYTHR